MSRNEVNTLVVSLVPYRFATRPRKAATQFAERGTVKFLSLRAMGRTNSVDVAMDAVVDGVHVVQLNNRIPSTGTTRASQMHNLFLVYGPGFFRLLKEVVTTPADNVMVTGSQLAPLGIAHKAIRKSRLILDINERPASFGLKKSLSSVFVKAEPAILRLSAKWADVCTVVAPGHAAILQAEYGFDSVKVMRNLPLVADRASFSPPPIAGPIRFVLVGTLFEGRALETLINAVGELDTTTREAIRVDIYGPGRADYIDALTTQIRTLGLGATVQLHGRVDRHKVSQCYLDGHVGLALYDGSDAHNDSLSNKLLECLSVGRPVLAGDLPENAKFLAEWPLGWTAPVSVEGITNAIREIVERRNEISDMSVRAREAGDTWMNWQSEFSRVL